MTELDSSLFAIDIISIRKNYECVLDVPRDKVTEWGGCQIDFCENVKKIYSPKKIRIEASFYRWEPTPVMKISFQKAIDELGLLRQLRKFNPIVIGTPPLGIETSQSDIDIACHSKPLSTFRIFALQNFSKLKDFLLYETTAQNQAAMVARFQECGWHIELFCQSIPSEEQWGVRHYKIEQRLLQVAPAIKSAVLKLKLQGMKTEPAFAHVLNLHGDPYRAILGLEHLGDRELISIVPRQYIARTQESG